MDSDAQITATSPPGTGTVDATVVTPAGTSPGTTADQFTYAILPVVTVTGTGFTGATDVSFGPASATAMNVDSDTQITAISPPGTCTVDITVTTPAGVSPASPRRPVHLHHLRTMTCGRRRILAFPAFSRRSSAWFTICR